MPQSITSESTACLLTSISHQGWLHLVGLVGVPWVGLRLLVRSRGEGARVCPPSAHSVSSALQ